MTAWKLWANVAACDAKYYPGMVGAICLIRAPSVAQWALGLCKKSILDEATAAKITLDASHDPTPPRRTWRPRRLRSWRGRRERRARN